MFRLFGQPYPANDSLAKNLRRSALIGLFVGLFLLVFQPFNLSLWKTDYKALKLLGFGVVTAVVTAVNFIVWPRLFPRQFSETKWTVGREILLITFNILLIAVTNGFYMAALIGDLRLTGLNWVSMVLVTYLVGLFPVTGVVLLNYIAQLRKYSRAAAELPVHSVPSPESVSMPDEIKEQASNTVEFVAENEKDKLVITATDLLYVESSDNYCTIVYLKNGQPVKPLLRSSLSRLENQLNQSHIVRCHRSYLVNLDRVERVTGNAQGYKLHLLNNQFIVPVSRQYNDTLVAELKAL
ncbi:LytR/AlgR family response regulator transcription factor [Spirosoma sp. KUDC1026]|uniref:LytR/AlgR family response regulator transcription factor n=1 Tax=Spirosoma sp. KUDC1026 TaxID=2745947 RepID=UPI00159BB55D|nr:LytTR family DNA-binding domain-containing protein [Spirosoma sp. KUDC1026]QKZ11277.1 LytTR family transcriptional regulator [Spirosoma sp. KUDC1026]